MQDKQIIALFFERNEQAVKEVALKYGKLIFSLSKNILLSSEDARECVNDTYLVLWNTIPPQNPEPFISYICKITRNISIKLLRNKTAQKRNGITVSIAELEDELFDSGFEDKINERELGRKIDEFLSKTDKESRVIFLKRYWFCEEITEIATCFGMSESNVYQKLSRTRKKLKAYLKKEGII